MNSLYICHEFVNDHLQNYPYLRWFPMFYLYSLLALFTAEGKAITAKIHHLEDFLQKYKQKKSHVSVENIIIKPKQSRSVPYIHMNSKYVQWTRLVKYHIFIGMIKTYYLDIIISTLEELPEQQELEGAFDGLFLLHET